MTYQTSHMTPKKAIHAKCMECCCNQPNEIKLCPVTDCPLYPHRFVSNSSSLTTEEKERLAEVGAVGKGLCKVINAKCLDCTCYQPGRIKECQFTDCALYPYRMGHNPNYKGATFTPEQIERSKERLMAYQAARKAQTAQ